MDAAFFFRAIYKGYNNAQDRWMELRLKSVREKGVMQSRWFPLTSEGLNDAARTSMQESKTHDVYFGVLPRSKTRGIRENVTAANILFAEIDGGKGGFDGALRLLCSAMAEGRIPGPHIVVNSGGGCHIYFRLRDTCVTSETDMSMILKRLCMAIGGVRWENRVLKPIHDGRAFADPVSTDLPRILRVPGTWNHKPSRNCAVSVLDWQGDDPPESVTHWVTLLPQAPSLPPPRHIEHGYDTMTGLPPEIEFDLHSIHPEGTRHSTLRRILFVARKRDLDLQEIASTFRTNHPDCSERWLHQLVQSTLHRVQPELSTEPHG